MDGGGEMMLSLLGNGGMDLQLVLEDLRLYQSLDMGKERERKKEREPAF